MFESRFLRREQVQRIKHPEPKKPEAKKPDPEPPVSKKFVGGGKTEIVKVQERPPEDEKLPAWRLVEEYKRRHHQR